MRKTLLFFTILVFILSACVFCVLPADKVETITLIIDASAKTQNVNPRVYGTSILGWEANNGREKIPNYRIAADYGYGIWDGTKFCEEPLALIKNIDIRMIRLSGQFTDWEKGVPSLSNKEYKFGLDDQIGFCREIGAEPIICLQNLWLEDSYKRLAEYLKVHYPEVKYIEIGNESYFILKPQEYVDRYLHYYDMFKSINPNLMLGIVGYEKDWDESVVKMVGDRFDFIVKHYYPHGGKNNSPNQDSNKIYENLFTKGMAIEKDIKNTHNIIKSITGKDRPIAVTEFTAWFVQQKPVPYRHCLGTALVNAELLRIFMKPENNILCANYWNYINEYWGMVSNRFSGRESELGKSYFKRPNYYVFEMYAKHFGKELVQCSLSKNKYVSVNVSTINDRSKLYIMLVNRNLNEREKLTIDLRGFNPSSQAGEWVLTGKSIDSTNEKPPHNDVVIKSRKFLIKSNKFQILLEPRSVTAIEIERGGGADGDK